MASRLETRGDQLRAATALAAFTVVWNLVEGVVAVVAAVAAGSQALVGFGVDSFVESLSAGVLLWRLRVERRQPDRAERVERQAVRLIGVTFLILAVYVAFEAVSSVVARDEPEVAPVGIGLTVVSLIVMPVLAAKKRRVAAAMGSRAVEADSNQTMACVYLSIVVLVGLVLNAALGWWWADPAAALVVVGLLVREGREALTAETVDACCG